MFWMCLTPYIATARFQPPSERLCFNPSIKAQFAPIGQLAQSFMINHALGACVGNVATHTQRLPDQLLMPL